MQCIHLLKFIFKKRRGNRKIKETLREFSIFPRLKKTSTNIHHLPFSNKFYLEIGFRYVTNNSLGIQVHPICLPTPNPLNDVKDPDVNVDH